MTGRSTRSRRWVNGALKTARAAAFLTLATGINGTIAALEPRYEPIYVYLVAIVVVAWLSSLLLGVTAAVAAVIIYDWMFSPVRIVPSTASIVPFVAAVAVAVSARVARTPLVQRRELAPVPSQPLLAEPPQVVSVMPVADDRRIVELERRLAEARAEADREVRLHREWSATAQLQQAALQQELDAAATRLRDSETAAADLRTELERATSRTFELEQRISELAQEVDTAWGKVDAEKTRANREGEMRQQADFAAAEKLKKAVAELSARYQTPLNEAKARLAEAFTRIPQLEKERETLRAALTDAARMQKEFEQTLAVLRTGAEAEKRRADQEAARRESAATELQRARGEAAALGIEVETLRRQLDDAVARARQESEKREEAAKEFDHKLQKIVADITTDHEEAIGQAMLEREGAKAEARTLAKKLESLQKQLAEATARGERASLERDGAESETRGVLQQLADEVTRREELQKQLAAETARREAIAKDYDAKLQSIVANITSDHEEAIGQAMLDREGAKAEARTLTKKVETLQKQLAEEIAGREEITKNWDAKLQEIVTNITTDHEETIGQTMLERERAKAELRSVQKQLAEEIAKREALAKDYDGKLQKIVANITSDHEEAIGEAMLEKEAARAEARTLAQKLETLQEKASAMMERVQADLQAEIALREKMTLDFDARIQSIVTNLTSDYENTLGEALVEKEAARAEIRTLTAKVTALQQKLERERATPAAAPSQRSVLIVHSDAGMRAMAKQALEPAGYTVLTATDGLEGLRIAGAQRPQAVVAEAMMPKMNARELIQLLKSRSDTAGMKIILVSNQSGDLERGTDFRADEVLTNPRDFDALRSALDRLLAGR
jgi:CheY-like chemotaxis protein/chromosome segregation ATPase